MTREMETAERIVRAFREYKIAIIPIVSEDLTTATLTFERINSQGTAMSKKHMVHALTWSEGFDLQSRFESLKAEHLEPVGWAQVDDERILDACGAALGMRLLDRDVDRLSARIKQDPATIGAAVRAMAQAAVFFRERCAIGSPGMVPYREQIALLTEAFRTCPDPKEAALDTLHAWVWLSTYGGLFGGSSVKRLVGGVAEDVKHMIADGRPRWPAERRFERSSLAPGVDLRTPRGKALAVRLAERARINRSDDTPMRLLSDRGTDAVRRLFPYVRESLRGSPGNCFIAAQEDVAFLRERLRRLSPGVELTELRRAHVVSDAAFADLRAGRFEDFISQRRADLDKLEDELLAPLVERFKDVIASSKGA
jgi:hypothetical protein